MGDPKKPRAKFNPPRNPWRSDQLSQELYLLGTYGLRNKRELWRAQTYLSNLRKQARHLLAASTETRGREEPKLLSTLVRKGLIKTAQNSLDDVLSLTIENVLERRLQTLVWRRGLATSPYQARQYVCHGHISIDRRKISIPSYLVSPDEEGTLGFSESSRVAKAVQAAAVAAVETTAEPDSPAKSGAEKA
jgi:small subunit ribosomal protein S4